MRSYLQISGLTKCYGTTLALEDIQFCIERGSVLALLGPNGAGKSTLFSCLLGLARPDSGVVRLNGAILTDAGRVRVGYLAERVALYPQRTVADNGAFFARLRGQSMAEMEKQIERVGLRRALDRPVRQLSKGMLQRLGLAIALCGQPELLVLDEPFNGLDPAVLDTMQAVLREETQRGATLLISTHTMSAVEPLASHVAILLKGRLVAFGTLEELQTEQGERDSLEAIYYRIARKHHEVEEVFA